MSVRGLPSLPSKRSALRIANIVFALAIFALGVAGTAVAFVHFETTSLIWAGFFVVCGAMLIRDARRRWGHEEAGDYRALRVMWTYVVTTVVVIFAAVLGWLLLAAMFKVL
jgi:hypothetical protein